VNKEASWLRTTVAMMKSPPPLCPTEMELASVGCANIRDLSPDVGVYLRRLIERGAGLSIGNFDFWSIERIRSKADSPEIYGGNAKLLLIADWMLDSEFCAVDVTTGLMAFLGGEIPIRLNLSLAEFLARVRGRPGDTAWYRVGPAARTAPKARPAHPRTPAPEHETFHVDPRAIVDLAERRAEFQLALHRVSRLTMRQRRSSSRASVQYLRGPGSTRLPEGLGQVIMPDGSIVPATHATLVPVEGGGFRSAFPIP